MEVSRGRADMETGRRPRLDGHLCKEVLFDGGVMVDGPAAVGSIMAP